MLFYIQLKNLRDSLLEIDVSGTCGNLSVTSISTGICMLKKMESKIKF